MKIYFEWEVHLHRKWRVTTRSIYTRSWESCEIEYCSNYGPLSVKSTKHANWRKALWFHFFGRY